MFKLSLRKTLRYTITRSYSSLSQMTTVLDRWKNINQDLKISDDVGEKWWNIIHRMYGEPQRHYHTIHHIEELFQHFDRCQEHFSFKYPTLVSLAIFFHE